MNDSNQFPSHGFANYDRPHRSQRKGIVEKVFGPGIANKMRNPLVATVSLLLVGAAFAGIIIVSYPDGDNDADNVPVIKAEKMAYKVTPEDAGGMDVPFQDSTIFMSMQGGELEETAPVENLLEEEEPVDRFAAFEAQDREDDRQVESLLDPAPRKSKETAETEVAEAETTADEEPFEIKKIEQTSEKIPPQDLASAAPDQPEKPKEIHAAGSSPETLAFVRSVLDQKDAGSTAADTEAAQVAAIEPAAGSVAASAIEPGEYFVQLASVTSETGAATEWTKLQKSYSSLLQNVSHRVKRADLDKGTYYRIQAGPMSKDSANTMCDAIKAQKPGGCLVVK